MLDFAPTAIAFPEWPTFGLYEDVMKFVQATCRNQQPVALATLVDTQGGSPRPIGTQMAFTPDDMIGFFSGGCIEADVALHARRTLEDGFPRTVSYGGTSKFRDIRLQCGASITIAIEKVMPSDQALMTYSRLRQARKEAVWITDGIKRQVGSDISDFEGSQKDVVPIALSSIGAGTHKDAYYWIRHRPPIRLILIGADPTTLAIARLAKEAEFEVVLVRRAGPIEAPPVNVDLYYRSSPKQVLSELKPDDRTAIVFADHDFDSNKYLVVDLLKSPIGYVGMIGAARQRLAKDDFLIESGVNDADIANFRSPVGIPLGKSSPVAIAISIIAQLISLMR